MFTTRFPKAVLGLVAIGLMVCAVAAAADRNPMALRILSNGTIMVAGSDGPSGFFVTGYSPSGALLSQVAVTLPFPPVKMAINWDGTVAVGAEASTNKGDIWVMKYYGKNGFPIWMFPAIYNGSGNGPDKLSNLGFDPQGNVFVSAASLSSSNNYIFATLKLDSITGVRHWVQEEEGNPSPSTASNWGNIPMAMAFNKHQDIQIAGKQWDGTDYNFATLCYAGSTGMKEFPTAVFDSGPNSLDVPTAMVVDKGDRITLTGYCSKGTKFVYATLQYDCNTGAVLWGPVMFGGQRDSVPTAMALDQDRNVFVTGYSEDNFGRDNFVTLKYELETGKLLWSATYRAFNAFGSYPVAMAVDGNGDVALTGMVTTQLNNTDYITMKYDGRTGALLWGPFLYDGKARGNDSPIGIAVDGSGNFVVTGFVESPLGNRPQTIKYDGLTGIKLWIR